MRQLNVVTVALLLFPLLLRATDNETEMREWPGARWSRVEDSILRKATLTPRPTCGSSLACSVVGAVVLPDCRFDVLLQRVMAKATLRLMGTIYYFRGAFVSIAERPRDPSVIDRATAIDHEYAYHITPAVNAVTGFLASFENASFPTIAECMLAGSELAKTVSTVFQQTLAETQAREVGLIATPRAATRQARR